MAHAQPVNDIEMRAVTEEFTRLRAQSVLAPLTVAVLGQTGVGKSSLLNALFGVALEVGDVRPTTKVPHPVRVSDTGEHALEFYDMPGIGESAAADAEYLAMYRTKLLESDIVLWALPAHTRATTADTTALAHLVADPDLEVSRHLARKIVLVATKADQLHPTPWIYAIDKHDGAFFPSSATRALLDQKEAFVESVFHARHAHLLSASTYLSDDFHLDDHPRFTQDDHQVTYRGYLSEKRADHYRDRYPTFAPVFDRLRATYRPVSSSALFRYGLTRLLTVVVDRLQAESVGRLQNFVSRAGPSNRIPIDAARSLVNIVGWDSRRQRQLNDF